MARSNNQRGKRERANLDLGGANSNLGREKANNFLVNNFIDKQGST